VGEYSLEVELREGTGKGVARKLRAAGRIPGILYGHGKVSTAVSVDPQVLGRLLKTSEAGMNTLIDVTIAGETGRDERVVLVKELQRDPVRGQPLHVDLYQVDLASKIEVEIPIHLVGRPRGVELDGGILDHSLRELEIACLPRAIPESIEVDVTGLGIGDTLHVRDLPLPQGVELLSEAGLSVASVVAPRVGEEEEAAAAAAAAEAEAGLAPAEGEPVEAETKEESSD
jgi:large subunit ribosomal protein L25